jgi:hypothetical protein
MSANLIEHLRQVKDFRTTDGRRHPLWLEGIYKKKIKTENRWDKKMRSLREDLVVNWLLK